MKKLLFSLSLLFFPFLIASAQEDELFWFVCPAISQTGTYDLDRPIHLYMTAFSTAATVTLSQPAGGGFPTTVLSIPANSTILFDMTPWLANLENAPANTVLNYGLKITSTAPITADYFNVGGPVCYCNPEDFILKGSNATGTDFWIPGQNILDNDLAYTPAPSNAFDIVATQDATTVTITPSNGIVGHTAGTAFTVTLNEGQTYSGTAVSNLGPNHLCGSHVTSDKPIAITEKDDLLDFYSSVGLLGTDLIGDQIVPVSVLGTEYIPMYGDLSAPGDKLFITATQNSTTISLNGTSLATINAGQTYEMDCPSPSGYLQTSFPAYVYQLSGIGSEVGSALLPQINCTGSNIVSFYQSSNLDFYVNLLVKNGGQGNFLVNGAAGVVTAGMFVAVPGTGGAWYSAQVPLSVGTYPLGSVLTISNTGNLFQLGFLGTGFTPNSGSSFGYFSNYGGVSSNAYAMPDSVCAGDSIHLYSDTVNLATYMWSGPAGFTSTLPDPSIGGSVLTDSGIYRLVITIPGCADTSTVTVAVHTAPLVRLPGDTAVCPGVPIYLYNLAGTSGTASMLWSTTATTDTIVAGSSGAYWLTVSNGGCKASDTTKIFSLPYPSVSLGEDTALCAGDTLRLSSTQPPGDTYLWNTGASSASIAISSAGAYWLKVTNTIGCAATDTVHVAINPKPTVNLGPDTTICTAETAITLQSSETYTGASYLWGTGNVTPSDVVIASGEYWLQVTVGGCSGSDSVKINFAAIPRFSLGNDTEICTGRTLTLSAPEQPAGTTYSWNTGSHAPSIEAANSGTYVLTVNLDGCSVSDSINVSEVALPFLYVGPDTTLCQGEELVVYANAGTADLLWFNGSKGQTVNVSQSGTYWATASNACGNVTASVHVSFVLCNIWFPSAFTPNGDGHNDVIGVLGTLSDYTDFSLSIYNRWGQRVYCSQDIYAGWDGNFNGVKQNANTYFYMIFYTIEGAKHMMKGGFELIR